MLCYIEKSAPEAPPHAAAVGPPPLLRRPRRRLEEQGPVLFFVFLSRSCLPLLFVSLAASARCCYGKTLHLGLPDQTMATHGIVLP
jgi:hypothetical protein